LRIRSIPAGMNIYAITYKIYSQPNLKEKNQNNKSNNNLKNLCWLFISHA